MQISRSRTLHLTHSGTAIALASILGNARHIRDGSVTDDIEDDMEGGMEGVQ
jgi:hypothetical protein